MSNVFHNTESYVVVDSAWIKRLKRAALDSPLKRARLCLHRSDDEGIHEMIIVLTRDCLFPPHKHLNKTESFHMIEGKLVVVLFSDDGKPLKSILLTPPGQGGAICYRLDEPLYHAVWPLDRFAVFHEITNGPFVKGDAIFAPWTTPALSVLAKSENFHGTKISRGGKVAKIVI